MVEEFDCRGKTKEQIRIAVGNACDIRWKRHIKKGGMNMSESKDSHEQDVTLRRWREWKRKEEKKKGGNEL